MAVLLFRLDAAPEAGDLTVEKHPLLPVNRYIGRRGELAFDLAADDLDAYRGRLVDAGVECASPKSSRTTGHRSFTFADPDGNVVTVTNAHPRMQAGPSRGRSRSRRPGAR